MNDFAEVIFATDTYGNITVWDLEYKTNLMTYKSGVINRRSLAVLNKDYILGVEKGPLIHAWPVNSQEKITNIRMSCPGVIGCFALSPDNLYVAVSIDNKLLIWQICTGKLLNTVSSHYQAISVIRWSEDSCDVVTGGEDGLVCVWKLSHAVAVDYTLFGLTTGATTKSEARPRFTFSDHSVKITDLFLGRGKRARLFTASVDKSCKIYDLGEGDLLLNVIFNVRPTCIIADIPESNVFVGSDGGSIKTLSLHSPPRTLDLHFDDTNLNSFDGHKKSITCLVMSNDGSKLVSGSVDESIKIWNIESRQCLSTIPMRGSITNLLVRIESRQFNSPDFQPKAVLKSFQKRYDDNFEEVMTIYCPEDLNLHPFSDSDNDSDFDFQSQESENEAVTLLDQLEEMKRNNRELFNATLKHLVRVKKATLTSKKLNKKNKIKKCK